MQLAVVLLGLLKHGLDRALGAQVALVRLVGAAAGEVLDHFVGLLGLAVVHVRDLGAVLPKEARRRGAERTASDQHVLAGKSHRRLLHCIYREPALFKAPREYLFVPTLCR